MDDEEDTEHTDQVTSSQEVQSRYQIMKFKHLESKLESKKQRISELEAKLETKK